MTRTVFVTGGAGYVGSHCCKAFAEAGWRVVVYDNLSRGWRDFVRWGPFIEGDILDVTALQSAMKDVRPDAVVHFAALAYIEESVANPTEYYRINAAGSLNILDAMRKCDVPAIVFSSTCATYGVPLKTPIDEGHPQNPINPYGWSKLFVERMLGDHDRAYGIRHVVLRYFNAAGADPGTNIGERHQPETHVIPLAIQSAMLGDSSFTVHGTDYTTPDGTAVRDFVHVSDLAVAHLKALNHLCAAGGSDVFNLGTGTGTSVREIAEAVGRVAGRTLAHKLGPRRQGDPPSLVASAEKAHRVLGWRPQRSSIETIVADAWRWHQVDVRSGFLAKMRG